MFDYTPCGHKFTPWGQHKTLHMLGYSTCVTSTRTHIQLAHVQARSQAWMERWLARIVSETIGRWWRYEGNHGSAQGLWVGVQPQQARGEEDGEGSDRPWWSSWPLGVVWSGIYPYGVDIVGKASSHTHVYTYQSLHPHKYVSVDGCACACVNFRVS